LTVDRGGAIPFYCTIHGSATGSGMAGVIVVEHSKSANGASQVAQARTNTALPGNGAANNSPAATTTANDSAPAYLAAGALLISCLTLVFAVALVRAPRREQRAARQS
jgi:hypothetical protein